jgi:hypothetical protein
MPEKRGVPMRSAIVNSQIEKWAGFYRGEKDRRFLIIVDYPEKEATGRPLFWPSLEAERVEWMVRNYEALLRHVELVRDDSVPYLDNMTGTEVFAEACGCEVHRPSGMGVRGVWDNMPFALPFIHSAREAAALRVPALGACTLDLLLEMADAGRKLLGEDAVMRLVDVQSPLDIVALMWEKLDLYPALLDEPEAVRGLADKVMSLYTAFFDEWFRSFGRDFVAHFPVYYMPAGLSLSEDEVGAVGPELFDALFLPELAALSDRYGGLGMHCCADSRHQWEGFAKIPGLRMINIHKESLAVESLSYVAGRCPMIPVPAYQESGGPREWIALVPEGGRAVFHVNAGGIEEARALVEEFREATGA